MVAGSFFVCIAPPAPPPPSLHLTQTCAPTSNPNRKARTSQPHATPHTLDLHDRVATFQVVQSDFTRRCDAAVGDGRDAGGGRGGGDSAESALRCKLTAMDDAEWSEFNGKFNGVAAGDDSTDTCSDIDGGDGSGGDRQRCGAGRDGEESERRRNSETEAMRVAAVAALAPDVGCQLLWAASTDTEPEGFALPCAGECGRRGSTTLIQL